MDKREDVKSYYPGDCGKDKREDSGNYYPGGTVVPQGKVPSGQENFVQKQEGLEVKTNTITDLREAVKDLAKAMGATVVSAFAAMAAFSAEVQTAKLGEIELDTGRVVTNVVLDGLAKTADLDGKRDKTDLNVYSQSTMPKLPDECFPVQAYGVNYGPDDVTYFFDENNNIYLIEVGAARVFFRLPDLTFYGGYPMTFNGKSGTIGKWPKLEFAIIPTGDTLATTSTVANIARSVVNTVWDAELGVAWEARMHNGALYYVAVTNKPPEVK